MSLIANPNVTAKIEVTCVPEVESIQLEAKDEYFVNTTEELFFFYEPEDADAEFVWTSSDESICVVDNGVITTLKGGYVEITCETIDGKVKQTVGFKVYNYATEIKIVADTRMYLDTKQRILAELGPEPLKGNPVFASSDDSILAVDGQGIVTAKALGKATITVTSSDGGSAKGTVEIEVIEPIYDTDIVIGDKKYPTLNAALEAAVEGDTIKLPVGKFENEIVINKNNITIAGYNAGINAAKAPREDETVISGKITIASGVVGAKIDGCTITGAAIGLEADVNGFTLQYCVIENISQDGVVRGPSEGEVKNIRMRYNYSSKYNSFRFAHFSATINGLEMVGNELECTGTYDFLNVMGILKGTVLIKGNKFSNSAQSFLYASGVGVLDCTISENVVSNIASTFIDFRDMKEDGAVKVDIYDNEFKDSVIGWMPIRIRTAGYDANDSIVVNVFDNKFIEAFAPDTDGINYYIQNPSYSSQSDPFKKIYVVGKNLFIENGVVITNVNNTQFLDSAISFEEPYSSVDEMTGVVTEITIGTTTYETLEDALAAAVEGDTIKLPAGEYANPITISVNNLTIQGPNKGVNAANTNRNAEAIFSAKITIAEGVQYILINGVEFTGAGAVSLEIKVSDITVQYCVFTKTSQDGVVRGPAEGEVRNIKMLYNYSNAFTSYRFAHFASVINGLELIGNELECTNTYDFLNVLGMLKGKVVVKDNKFVKGNQSFMYVLTVGVLDCTISGNYISEIANTFIDLRDMKEDGAVVVNIFNNDFRDSFTNWQNAWVPIRIKAGGYDDNDSIAVKVYDNKFINAGALDTDGEYYYLQNPGIANHPEKWKKIYTVGKNYFEIDGKVYTDVNNKHFLNSAISFEEPYTSEGLVPGFGDIVEIKPTSVEITNKVSVLDAFSDYKVTFNIGPINATNTKVGFKSSDTSVATITSAGVISTKSAGTCTITVYSLADSSVYDSFVVEVAPKERIEIRYEGTGVINVNGELQLDASYHGMELQNPELTYISSDENIATVDNNGKITAVAEGQVTITVKVGDIEAKASFTIVKNMDELNELLQLLVKGNNANVLKQNVMYIGSDDGSGDFEHLVYGSVNDFYAGTTPEVIRNMLSTTAENYDGRQMKSVEFIVFHDTAGAPSGSTAKANSGWCNNPSNTGGSWHYTIGNDGIYQQIEDNMIAWHAGDSISWSEANGYSTMLFDTGIKADPDLRNRATADLNEDGYFYINGQKTLVKMPEGATVATGTNTLGIACVVKDGNYYIPTTWISNQFGNPVCIRGGNTNGIGIESCVNSGSDVWLTWQYSAKFIAQLLIKHNITPERVVFHNNFTNKPCPRTMMTADLVEEFLDLVYLEYYVAKNYSDYTITFESHNPDILDNTGRIVKRPEFTTNVSYTVTVSKGNESQSVTLNALVLGLYN